MGFWISMFIVVLIIPITMIGFGKYLFKSGPKDINSLFGYRTSRSMKSKETWEFAQKYCGRIWYKAGLVLLLSVLVMFFVIGKDNNTISYFGIGIVLIQIIPLVGTFIPVEKALRKNFDENGNKIK